MHSMEKSLLKENKGKNRRAAKLAVFFFFFMAFGLENQCAQGATDQYEDVWNDTTHKYFFGSRLALTPNCPTFQISNYSPPGNMAQKKGLYVPINDNRDLQIVFTDIAQKIKLRLLPKSART
jgi:hypothetical protein